MTKKTKKLKQILDKISTTEEKFLDAVENGEEIAEEEALKAYKALSTPEEKVMDFLENIENFKGKDGKTPTPEELQAIIKPLIPNVKDGETPTDEKLVELIKPLIPEPRQGLPGKNGNEVTADDINSKMGAIKDGTGFSVFKLKDVEFLRGNGKDKMQWNSVGGLSKVSHDTSLSGSGTDTDPLKVATTPASKFTQLTDVPHSYSGEAGKAVYVNGTEDGLIFQTAVSSDEKVKLSASDPTAGYLNDKLSGGTGITYNNGVIASTITQYTDAMAVSAVGTPWTGLGYITRSGVSAGTGISYDNSTGVITNSAPDQTVAINAGTNITSVTGTYPSFTINAATQTTDLSGQLHLDQTTPQSVINGPPLFMTTPTFTYTGGVLTGVSYPSGFTKTLSYNVDGTLNQIVYSNGRSKTMVWSGGSLIGITII